VKTWILAKQLIDGTGDPPSDNVAVCIADDRIAAIRPQRGFRPSRTDAVVDGGTASLIPGLIDAHVHLSFGHGATHDLVRAQVVGDDLSTLVLRAARNAQMCLQAGVTTVRDCGDRGLVTLALREAVEHGWFAAPRILASGAPITTTGGHLYWCGWEADSVPELRRHARMLCARGVDVIKVVATGGNMTAGTNPLQPQFTTAELRAVVREAHRLGRKVAAHVLNTEGIRRSLIAGVDTIEHCQWSSPEGSVSYESPLVDELVARAVSVNVTFAGVDRALLPRDDMSPSAASLAVATLCERGATAREMLAAGAELSIASDAGVRYSRFEDFAMSLTCATVAWDITSVEAIHRATLVPAVALGVSAELGSIEVGKQADLVLINGDPVKEITHLSKVMAVWRGGRLAMKDTWLSAPLEIPATMPAL